MASSLSTCARVRAQSYHYVHVAADDLDQTNWAAGQEILSNSSPSFQGKLFSRFAKPLWMTSLHPSPRKATVTQTRRRTYRA